MLMSNVSRVWAGACLLVVLGLLAALSGCGAPTLRAVGPRRAEATALLKQVCDAHGGLDRWQRLDRIDLTLSTDGQAFTMRKVSGKMRDKRIEVYPHQFKTVIHDFPKVGSIATWEGDRVTIQPPGTQPALVRENARAHFSTREGRSRWDDLDLAYFVGYAIWNYMNFPFVLNDEQISVEAAKLGGRPMLDVQYPEGFPAHSRRQFFMLTKDGRLVRQDYVAEVLGDWATAANRCQQSQTVDGLVFYTKRKILPSVGRSCSMPFPNMLWIEVKDLKLTFKKP